MNFGKGIAEKILKEFPKKKVPKEHLKEFPVILHTKFQSVFSTESTKKNSEWISKRAHKIGEETKKKSWTIPKDYAAGVFKIIIDIFS